MHPARTARAGRRRDRERGPVAAVRASRDDGQAGLSFELYLARHGETEWSRSGRHTGTTDLPLTERGEENAEALGLQLSVVRFDAVFSSPLQRALRTAELAGFEHPRVTPVLREVDYGEYEGLTTDEIHRTNPGWELYRDGSPGGETPAQIAQRAAEFIELVIQTSVDRAIAFAHGHILRAIAATWIHSDITVAAGLQLDPATVNVLREADRGRVIRLWNSG